jgi:hypothetical protein
MRDVSRTSGVDSSMNLGLSYDPARLSIRLYGSPSLPADPSHASISDFRM